MIYFFTGNYKGEQFIGVRAPNPRQHFLAGMVLDSLSDRNGPEVPGLNSANALIRKLSDEVLPHMVEFKLESVAHARVLNVAEIATKDLAPFFSPTELDGIFPQNDTQEATPAPIFVSRAA